jgi:hypothetical protein
MLTADGETSPMPVSSTPESSALEMERRAAITSGRNTSRARGRLGSRLRKPLPSSTRSWWATLEDEVRPTAWPISRIDGG